MSSSSSPSSSVQQEQLTCARSNSFLYHKGSSSTSTWRRGGRWTRKNLLLHVCVHPLFHFTHQQQLSQYTTILSGPHRIETEAMTLTDHGNCKLSCLCCSCLFVLPLSYNTCFFFFPKNLDLIWLYSDIFFSVKSKSLDTIYATCNTSLWLRCDRSWWFERWSFSAVPGGQREKLLWEFYMGPSQWWDHRSEKVKWTNLWEFTCQWTHSSCWYHSCCSLLVAISCPDLNLAEIPFRFLALVR